MNTEKIVEDNINGRKYNNEDEYELLSLKEAKNILGVGINAMYELVNTGKIPYIKVSNAKKIRRGALYNFILENETTKQ